MPDLSGMYADSPIIAYWKTRKDGIMQIRKSEPNGGPRREKEVETRLLSAAVKCGVLCVKPRVYKRIKNGD